ncbi:MAG: hypothetical protein IPN17_29685 [Deltaproteobacteria bacterium]|nr:hypothetical protein [Deltaproteobacteria bacterium]
MARLDVEWLAFTAGLKPAVRRTVDPARADEVAARFVREGAAVLRADRHAVLGGREQVVLYAARSHDLAAALRDAEATVLPGHPTVGDVVAAHRAVGAALGFPACCVGAFWERPARGWTGSWTEVPGASRRTTWPRALRGWPRPTRG